MADSGPNLVEAKSWLNDPAISVALELLPIFIAILCGMLAGTAGLLFVDWSVGLICLAVGGVVGLILGFVLQILCSVFWIWASVATEAKVGRNYLPLLCGIGGALYSIARIVMDGAGNDLGLLAFGSIVSFTFAGGIGAVLQSIVRRVNRSL